MSDNRSLADHAIGLSRFSKRVIVALLDAALCAISVYLAIYLRIGEAPQSGGVLWIAILVAIVLVLPIFSMLGLYRAIFSQNGTLALFRVSQACTIYGMLYAAVFTFGGIVGVPRTVGLIQPLLLFILASASRIFARYWLAGTFSISAHGKSQQQRAIIYGAGSAGRQLAAAMELDAGTRIVGFVDDDTRLQGHILDGRPIFAPKSLPDRIERLRVTDLLLAIPSASPRRHNELIRELSTLRVHVRTLPGITNLAKGRVSAGDVRELEISELLGREAVPPDPTLLGLNITGKTVLITGAGGSIGSEISRQALALAPRVLLLLDFSEFAIYSIHHALNQQLAEWAGDSVPPVIVPILGSVLDEARMRLVIEHWRPDTIYHAAAYKHVPLVEQNPAEGVRNNLLGTWRLGALAGALKVPTFILISTDKAVRPTNVMGATKRGAELVLQALNTVHVSTTFAMVRFGNVLGSSGSVVPLFRKQIAEGGPITVTDFRITRYFMTIPEAAQLVINAGTLATGGDIFLLDMGEPVNIIDLAHNMVKLSGLTIRDASNPDGDINIVETGLRPGEKLYEELLIGNRSRRTVHPRIFIADEDFLPFDELKARLDLILAALEKDDTPALLSALKRLVPEFTREPDGTALPHRSAPKLVATQSAA
jgi:FlaA1/EpsC-like NDP-sugar epimerase